MQSSTKRKVLVLGGTGPSGQKILKECLKKGFECTSVTRNLKKKLPEGLEKNVTWVEGEVADKKQLKEIITGYNAVICCIGTSDKLGKTNLYSNAITNLLEVMDANKIDRLIFVTAAHDKPFMSDYFKNVVKKTIYNNIFDDMSLAEDILKQYKGKVNWTVIKPFMFDYDSSSSYNYKALELKDFTSGEGWKWQTNICDIGDFSAKEIIENKFPRKLVFLGN